MDAPIRNQVNGTWKKTAALVSVGGFILIVGGYIFGAGKTDAFLEQRVTRVETDVATMHGEYARKDVVEQRLINIEHQTDEIKANEKELAQKLDELLIEAKRRR